MRSKEALQKRICELCRQNCLTLTGLASLCGITQSTLNNIMSGRNNSVTVSTVQKICDGLQIEVHNDPAHALCDGPQSLKPEQFDLLAKKLLKLHEMVKSLEA